MATYSHESEMALFHECTLQCAQKGLDTADIVRDGDVTPNDPSPLFAYFEDSQSCHLTVNQFAGAPLGFLSDPSFTGSHGWPCSPWPRI
jgi:hypothetical protein